eukprot:129161-Amphidinium_carterae.1
MWTKKEAWLKATGAGIGDGGLAATAKLPFQVQPNSNTSLLLVDDSTVLHGVLTSPAADHSASQRASGLSSLPVGFRDQLEE